MKRVKKRGTRITGRRKSSGGKHTTAQQPPIEELAEEPAFYEGLSYDDSPQPADAWGAAVGICGWGEDSPSGLGVEASPPSPPVEVRPLTGTLEESFSRRGSRKLPAARPGTADQYRGVQSKVAETLKLNNTTASPFKEQRRACDRRNSPSTVGLTARQKLGLLTSGKRGEVADKWIIPNLKQMESETIAVRPATMKLPLPRDTSQDLQEFPMRQPKLGGGREGTAVRRETHRELRTFQRPHSQPVRAGGEEAAGNNLMVHSFLMLGKEAAKTGESHLAAASSQPHRTDTISTAAADREMSAQKHGMVVRAGGDKATKQGETGGGQMSSSPATAQQSADSSSCTGPNGVQYTFETFSSLAQRESQPSGREQGHAASNSGEPSVHQTPRLTLYVQS